MPRSAVLLLVVATASLGLATNPGLRAFLTQSGLDYAADVGMTVLEQQLESISLPDISGSTHVSVIGDLTYSLSKMALGTTTFGSYSATFQSGSLKASVSGITIKMSCHWHYREKKWPHLKGSGNADITVSDSSLSATLTASESGGLPTVSVSSVSVDIDKIKIKVHDNGASWLYNLFVDLFKGKIKSEIESTLRSQLPSLIENGVNSQLKNLPTKQRLNSVVGLDYSLVDAPFIDAGGLRLDDTGMFYPEFDHYDPMFTAGILPTSVSSSHDVVMLLDEYVAETASWCYFVGDQMQGRINADDLPTTMPLQLDTTAIGLLVPEVPLKYGFGLPMYLEIAAAYNPLLTITSEEASLVGAVRVDLGVIMTNKTTSIAFTLMGNADAKINTVFAQNILSGNVNSYHVDWSIYESNVGNFTVDPLLWSLVMVTNLFEPKVNELLNIGFPVPSIPGLEFESPDLVLKDSYLWVSTNIRFTDLKLREFLGDDEPRLARLAKKYPRTADKVDAAAADRDNRRGGQKRAKADVVA